MTSTSAHPRFRDGPRLRGILAAGAALALFLIMGCEYNASVHGLRPISPPVQIGAIFGGYNGQLVYPVVNFMHPRFEWQAFVPPKMPGAGIAGPTNIVYDLRIWKVRNGSLGDLVYERKDLPAPRHELEQPLELDTRYFWSVRARFEINGEVRLADWSRSLQPDDLHHRADLPAPIPPANYFRFITSGY